jgi:hypothetical protein
VTFTRHSGLFSTERSRNSSEIKALVSTGNLRRVLQYVCRLLCQLVDLLGSPSQLVHTILLLSLLVQPLSCRQGRTYPSPAHCLRVIHGDHLIRCPMGYSMYVAHTQRREIVPCTFLFRSKHHPNTVSHGHSGKYRWSPTAHRRWHLSIQSSTW